MSRSTCLPAVLLVGLLSVALAGVAAAPKAVAEPEKAVAEPETTAAEPETTAASEAGAAKGENPFSDTACASEFDRLCTHTRGWRLGFECLRGNHKMGSLAKECADWTDQVRREQHERAMARQRAWQEACAEDIAAHCSQYEKNKAIKGCLYQVRDQVAPECDEKLPRRNVYQGPGFAGWRDGSESEEFLEERRRRLRPREAQRIENARKREEEHARKRAEVRERIARNKAAAEARKAEAADPEAAKAAAERAEAAQTNAAKFRAEAEAAVDTPPVPSGTGDEAAEASGASQAP